MAEPSGSSGVGDCPFLHETVWLKQQAVEEAEAAFQKLSIGDGDTADCVSASSAEDLQEVSPYMFETVWLQQGFFEKAETWCQEVLAGTADPASLPVSHGTPIKRHHAQEKTTNKKMKSDKDMDPKQAKLCSQLKSLTKSSSTIHQKLKELENNQKNKKRAIQQAFARLNSTLETCQANLLEELQNSCKISWFRSLLKDMNSVIEKTSSILQDEDFHQTKALSSFYQTMSQRIKGVERHMTQCIEACTVLQAEVPKAEINRIVAMFGKLTLFKKKPGSETFAEKQEVVSQMLKDLMLEKFTPVSRNSSVASDLSMEANVSSSQSSEEKEDGVSGKSNSSVKKKAKKRGKKRLPGGIKPAVEGQTTTPTKPIPQMGGGKAKASVPPGKQSSAAKKRNAQGSQSNPDQKRSEVFRFKGAGRGTMTGLHLHQPGILGPRPNFFPMSDTNQSFSHGFQGFSRMGGMMDASNKPNFDFSQYSTQQGMPAGRGMTGNAPPNLNVPGGNASGPGKKIPGNRVRQSKLYQMQQRNQHHEFQPGFGMSYPQGQLSPNMMASGPSSGGHLQPGSVEQQLNEIAHKIQQMQLTTAHDYQLQCLMQETQRLKHIVAQNQHEQHQQQDHFQQQFQLLINAFVQQQQMAAQQQPQPKMAKAMPSQQQRMFLNKQYQLHQQQKKQKQQQNKSQHAKQDGFTSLDNNSSKLQASNAEKKSARHQDGFPNSKQGKSNGVASKVPNKNSKLVRKGLFNPFAQGDRHQAGVSSIVVLEALNCVVLVDIINNCLKLYDISSDGSSSNSLNHRLVTRLDLPQPLYMTRLSLDSVVVSRHGQVLNVVKVSKRRLEVVKTLACERQYYGLAYISPNQLACAAFRDNRIDLVSIKEDLADAVPLTSQCVAPELVSSLPDSNIVVYLERDPNPTVKLHAVNFSGQEKFVVDLDCQPDAVWNFVSCGDKIICSNKSSHKLKMFSVSGSLLTELHCPGGTMMQPFAMAFSDQGFLYVANDGAWDGKYEHYVTTEINIFAFS